MPNQSLSGKSKNSLDGKLVGVFEDFIDNIEHMSYAHQGFPTEIEKAVTALKSCLVEEIRGMEKNPVKGMDDVRYNQALDDVLRRVG